ncbi:hypothetical protein [Microbacterium sp. JZ31]|uniref:hypothetical protein n=1 Tax=Microbacterium sp. JZ31 TaxID=1906274 RepID=UPI0019323EE0|nr:hypothetical protein [Microbacterium sp. JZ31]
MSHLLAGATVVLGVVVTIAGGGAMVTHGMIADETGISGWNPWLWLILVAGAATLLVGVLQLAAVLRDPTSFAEARDPETPAPS